MASESCWRRVSANEASASSVPVSALALVDEEHVAAGAGPFLRIYSLRLRALLHQLPLLEEETVHGLSAGCAGCLGQLLLVHGVREVRALAFERAGTPSLCLRAGWTMGCRVLDCAIIAELAQSADGADYVAIGCDDNSVSVWEVCWAIADDSGRSMAPPPSRTLRPLRTVACSTKSVLYAMALRPPMVAAAISDHACYESAPRAAGEGSDEDTDALWLAGLIPGDKTIQKSFLVASGSAFRTVLVWEASDAIPDCLLSEVAEDKAGWLSLSVPLPQFQDNLPYFPFFGRPRLRPPTSRPPPLLNLTGHEGSVFALHWSPCGTAVASVSDDRRAMVWTRTAVAAAAARRLLVGTTGKCGSQGMCLRREIGDGVGASGAKDTYCMEHPATDVPADVGWFAHTARPWTISWVHRTRRASVLVTAGEDGCARLWRLPMQPLETDEMGLRGTKGVAARILASEVQGYGSWPADAGPTYGGVGAPWGVLEAREEPGLPAASSAGNSAFGGVELLDTLRGHEGKHVWSAAASSAVGVVVTGGADGGVRVWSVPVGLASSDERTGSSEIAKAGRAKGPPGVAESTNGAVVQNVIRLQDAVTFLEASRGAHSEVRLLAGAMVSGDKPDQAPRAEPSFEMQSVISPSGSRADWPTGKVKPRDVGVHEANEDASHARALQLFPPVGLIVACNSGRVWIMPLEVSKSYSTLPSLGAQAPASLLHHEPGTKWAALLAGTAEGAGLTGAARMARCAKYCACRAIETANDLESPTASFENNFKGCSGCEPLLVGSTCGEVRLLGLSWLPSPRAATRSPDGAKSTTRCAAQVSAELLLKWRAHPICVLHFCWVASPRVCWATCAAAATRFATRCDGSASANSGDGSSPLPPTAASSERGVLVTASPVNVMRVWAVWPRQGRVILLAQLLPMARGQRPTTICVARALRQGRSTARELAHTGGRSCKAPKTETPTEALDDLVVLTGGSQGDVAGYLLTSDKVGPRNVADVAADIGGAGTVSMSEVRVQATKASGGIREEPTNREDDKLQCPMTVCLPSVHGKQCVTHLLSSELAARRVGSFCACADYMDLTGSEGCRAPAGGASKGRVLSCGRDGHVIEMVCEEACSNDCCSSRACFGSAVREPATESTEHPHRVRGWPKTGGDSLRLTVLRRWRVPIAGYLEKMLPLPVAWPQNGEPPFVPGEGDQLHAAECSSHTSILIGSAVPVEAGEDVALSSERGGGEETPLVGGIDLIIAAFVQKRLILWRLSARQQLLVMPSAGYKHPKDVGLWTCLPPLATLGTEPMCNNLDHTSCDVPVAAVQALVLAYSQAGVVRIHHNGPSASEALVHKRLAATSNANVHQGCSCPAPEATGRLRHERAIATMYQESWQSYSLEAGIHGKGVHTIVTIPSSTGGLAPMLTATVAMAAPPFAQGSEKALRGLAETVPESDAQTIAYTCPLLLATGGEDNMVRILTATPQPLPRHFTSQIILSGHPAPVRALATCAAPVGFGADVLLFSAGGKEVLKCWGIQLPTPATLTSASTPLRDGERQGLRVELRCSREPPARTQRDVQRRHFGLPSNPGEPDDRVVLRRAGDSDARYMVLAAATICLDEDGQREGSQLSVCAAGTSTGVIRLHLFQTPTIGDVIPHSSELPAPQGCGPVLSLGLYHHRIPMREVGTSASAGSNEALLVLAGDTSGKLTVWDVTPLLCMPTGASQVGSNVTACRIQTKAPRPLLQVQLHSMGLNALAISTQSFAAAGGSSQPIVVVTAGDDQAVGVLSLMVRPVDGCADVDAVVDTTSDLGRKTETSASRKPAARPIATSKNVRVTIRRQWRQRGAHGASVRAIACTGDFIFTCGHDQRLCAWKMDRAAATTSSLRCGTGWSAQATGGASHWSSSTSAASIGEEQFTSMDSPGGEEDADDGPPVLTAICTRYVGVQRVTSLAILSLTSAPQDRCTAAELCAQGESKDVADVATTEVQAQFKAVLVVGGHGLETVVLRL